MPAPWAGKARNDQVLGNHRNHDHFLLLPSLPAPRGGGCWAEKACCRHPPSFLPLPLGLPASALPTLPGCPLCGTPQALLSEAQRHCLQAGSRPLGLSASHRACSQREPTVSLPPSALHLASSSVSTRASPSSSLPTQRGHTEGDPRPPPLRPASWLPCSGHQPCAWHFTHNRLWPPGRPRETGILAPLPLTSGQTDAHVPRVTGRAAAEVGSRCRARLSHRSPAALTHAARAGCEGRSRRLPRRRGLVIPGQWSVGWARCHLEGWSKRGG